MPGIDPTELGIQKDHIVEQMDVRRTELQAEVRFQGFTKPLQSGLEVFSPCLDICFRPKGLDKDLFIDLLILLGKEGY